MTRKDYQRIADTLRAEHEHYLQVANAASAVSADAGEYWAQYSAVGRVIEAITETLAEDNPRFDRVRFRKACGLDS